MEARSLATFENVSYLYPGSETFALRDVNLTVLEGEFLGLIGPTGAGKSTLCLAFNGIVPQFFGGRFFGRITVAGLDTVETPISTLARHVGLVFEDPELQLTATSVESEVAFALENLQIPRDEMVRRIAWALDAVGLRGMEMHHPATLSGGEKQRLAIAAMLAVRPRLLVLDEPTAQLDPAGTQQIFALLREINRRFGITVLVASHAAEELAAAADRIALLAAGRLIAVGAPAHIYADLETLHRHHLRAPQVTEVFARLPADNPGFALPTTLAEGQERIRAWVARGVTPPPLPAPFSSDGAEGPTVLALHHVHHVYEDGTPALRDVSVEIHRGDYLLLAGQNGAGKTTLVRHLLHLLEPTAGQVLFRGQDVRALHTGELARHIGYVAQNPDRQLFNATVEEEVSFALRALGMPPAQVEARTEASLAALGLGGLRHRHPFSLARGDRARVVIAAVLAMEPEILIFDEPTTGQDVHGARQILEITRQLHRQGKTVVVISHHLYLLAAYARRIVVLHQGQVVLDAPTRQALHDRQALDAAALVPPQAVALAQEIARLTGVPCPCITPQEVAGYLLRLRPGGAACIAS
ncbi:MAG TPA: ABC transporter ATP-binding protein [Chloroflexi bacterium]|nr:ABC transporter ATP-binding protein [Chloroflexota bacterium]